jgi:rRNA maturation protein Nop10
MDLKKVGLVVGLVVVIVIAAVLALRRTSSQPGSEAVKGAAQEAAGMKTDKIDNKTFEIFSETLADWEGKYAPDAEGHYKNPKTGEYTVVAIHKCASCGELIPSPDSPGGPPKGKGAGLTTWRNEREQFLLDYKCPKCGKNAYTPVQARQGG